MKGILLLSTLLCASSFSSQAQTTSGSQNEVEREEEIIEQWNREEEEARQEAEERREKAEAIATGRMPDVEQRLELKRLELEAQKEESRLAPRPPIQFGPIISPPPVEEDTSFPDDIPLPPSQNDDQFTNPAPSIQNP